MPLLQTLRSSPSSNAYVRIAGARRKLSLSQDALRLLDAELEAQTQVEHHDETETEIAALPEGWGTTLTGEPMPGVVAAVRRSRAAH